jgi:hypothetical protein
MISKQAQSGDLLRHPIDLCPCVRRGEPDQQEKAAPDLSGGAPFDTDLRARDPLKQNAQALLDRY